MSRKRFNDACHSTLMGNHAHVNKYVVWAHYHCQLTVSHRRTVQLILEMLFVKFGHFSISCQPQADITYAIDSICTSWCVMCETFYV